MMGPEQSKDTRPTIALDIDTAVKDARPKALVMLALEAIAVASQIYHPSTSIWDDWGGGSAVERTSWPLQHFNWAILVKSRPCVPVK